MSAGSGAGGAMGGKSQVHGGSQKDKKDTELKARTEGILVRGQRVERRYHRRFGKCGTGWGS